MKLYIKRNDGDWSITDLITNEVASIRHLNELIRLGEEPFSLDPVEVEEGIYKWDPWQFRYVKIEAERTNEENIPRVQNTVALIIRIIGYLTILVGIVLGLTNPSGSFYTIMFIVSGIVSGMMFIGIAEIIQLLDKISRK